MKAPVTSRRTTAKPPKAAVGKTAAKKTAARSATKVPGKRGPARKPVTIDFHAHFSIPEIAEFARGHVVKTVLPANMKINKKAQEAAKRWRAHMEERIRDTAAIRLRDMDAMGVDIQVLTLSIVHHYTYWAAPEESLKMEAMANDRMAEIIAANPDRFVGLGGVPLQSPELATKELERCVKKLGLKGVQISSHANGMEIGDARLRPFWAKAEKLGAIVYIHPAGVMDPRYEKFQLWNSVGQSLEEAMAMSSLFYEGILDKYPNLKICIAHGGGFLPYNAGRVERNYTDKPFTRVNMSKSPMGYMKDFWYDSCVYTHDVLESLIQKFGAGKVVLGSDYPVGEMDPIGFIKRSRKITPRDKQRILSDNPAKLLGLSI